MQRRFSQGPAVQRGSGSLIVLTGHAGSVVFINNIRHGSTSDEGSLELKRVKAGSYPIRVRTTGFKDWTGSVVIATGAARRLAVSQIETTDEALLHFQRGESLRDEGKNRDAVEEYKSALALRADFPEARLAAARSLITLQVFDEAEEQLNNVLKSRRAPQAECRTVLANLRRYQGLVDESIIEYKKALVLARGVSPEAHIGLAIALEEQHQMDAAIREYRIGISQDMDTEPILYYLLGSALEKAEHGREAIEAYESYIRLDPDGQYATAVQSIVERLKKPDSR